jgi:hypothetical protein
VDVVNAYIAYTNSLFALGVCKMKVLSGQGV